MKSISWESSLFPCVLGLIGFSLGAFFVMRFVGSPSVEVETGASSMSVSSNPFQSWNELNAKNVKTVELSNVDPNPGIAGFNADHSHDEIHEEADDEPNLQTSFSPGRFNEASEIRRLLSRIDQAAKESVLNEHRVEIENAIRKAQVVERIHNVTFNTANPHLDHRDETYLVSAMQNSAAMRQFKTHPDAHLLIFGYASKDNDRRNKFFALNRAQSAEHALEEHREIIGFKGATRSWCVGETDLLSRETDEHCSQHNRAAEVWLVVSDEEVFEEIESDNFLKTRIRKSGHGHEGEHH